VEQAGSMGKRRAVPGHDRPPLSAPAGCIQLFSAIECRFRIALDRNTARGERSDVRTPAHSQKLSPKEVETRITDRVSCPRKCHLPTRREAQGPPAVTGPR